MADNRYYHYDHESCTFVEVQPSRGRRLGLAGALLAATCVLSVALTWGLDRFMGTPEEIALRDENQALQSQLDLVLDRMGTYSQRLESLAEHDQVLYRTLLGAEPISEEVRQVGVGGTDTYEEFSRYSPSTSNLLRETAQQLDGIERQISLQNTSFRELESLARSRELALAQMPAIKPVDGPVVSGFGRRMHPKLKVRRMHAGLDFLVNTGTPVFSTGEGVVKKVAYSAGYGKHVVIDHKDAGYTTLYAHLSEVPKHIRRGKKVKRGEEIALSGNTGLSTGPHLHYEVRDTDRRPLNPVQFFAPTMTPQEYARLLEEASRPTMPLDEH